MESGIDYSGFGLSKSQSVSQGIPQQMELYDVSVSLFIVYYLQFGLGSKYSSLSEYDNDRSSRFSEGINYLCMVIYRR